MSLKLLVFGDLLNFALFNCFFTIVIVPWIIFSWICHSLRNTLFRYFNKQRGKIRYKIRRFFAVFNLPVHRVLNRFQLALFNFHFGLLSSVEKSVLFNDDREVMAIMLVFTYRPIIIKKQ